MLYLAVEKVCATVTRLNGLSAPDGDGELVNRSSEEKCVSGNENQYITILGKD